MASKPFHNIFRLFKPSSPMSWYELTWPKDLDAEQVQAWLHSLSGNTISVGLRFLVVASQGTIKHYIALPAHHEKPLLASLKSFLPEIEVSSCQLIPLSPMVVAKLRMTSKNRVLNTAHPDIVSFGILSTLQSISRNETVALLWILGPYKSPVVIPNDFTSFSSSSFGGALLEALTGQLPTNLDSVALKSMRQKFATASWQAILLIGISAQTKKRRSHLLNHITGALKIAEAPGVRLGNQRLICKRFLRVKMPFFWPIQINSDELLGLLGWPLGNRNVEALQRIVSRQLPLPPSMSSHGPVIAVGLRNNQPIRLPITDSLMHLHVLGPTGVGKSTFLLHHIAQYIQKGHGLAVVDPKGDLITQILERVPKQRQQDVVVLDPSDTRSPVGLNPFVQQHLSSPLIADTILAIFHKLYGSYFGPRTQDILHAGLLTLLQHPQTSLCDLPLLYTNASFRKQLTSTIHDPLGLDNFWQWFDGLSVAERNAAIAPVLNKLRPFLLRPQIRNVLGQQKPKFLVSDIFTKRKILLVNLAKGKVGQEASQLFGSLIVSQIWQAAQTRATLPLEKRVPTPLFIDEMQDYLQLPMDIAEVLAQARSNGMPLILAHQHLGQLPKDLRSGVLANARSRVCFQLTHEDAYTLAKGSSLLTPEDFEQLPRYHIYSKLVQNGHVTNWVSGKTLPPSKQISDPGELLDQSRHRYGTPIAEITSDFQSRFTSLSPVPSAPIGRKKRNQVIDSS